MYRYEGCNPKSAKSLRATDGSQSHKHLYDKKQKRREEYTDHRLGDILTHII